MRRRATPQCPYCRMPDGSKARMHPKMVTESWISYVCDNCKAVAPPGRTHGQAQERAFERSEPVIMWFDRDSEPEREDDYLCEYKFVYPDNPDRNPAVTHYGVWTWKAKEHRFSCEGDRMPYFTCQMRVLRWMDFKDEPVATEVAI